MKNTNTDSKFLTLLKHISELMGQSEFLEIASVSYDKLLEACRMEDIDLVKNLLERGVNHDPISDDENKFITETPLSVACNSGNVEIIKLLISKGADVNFLLEDGTNQREENSYILEVFYKDSFDLDGLKTDEKIKEIISILIEAGIDMSSLAGENAIYYSCHEKRPELLKFFVENGVLFDQELYFTATNLHPPAEEIEDENEPMEEIYNNDSCLPPEEEIFYEKTKDLLKISINCSLITDALLVPSLNPKTFVGQSLLVLLEQEKNLVMQNIHVIENRIKVLLNPLSIEEKLSYIANLAKNLKIINEKTHQIGEKNNYPVTFEWLTPDIKKFYPTAQELGHGGFVIEESSYDENNLLKENNSKKRKNDEELEPRNKEFCLENEFLSKAIGNDQQIICMEEENKLPSGDNLDFTN